MRKTGENLLMEDSDVLEVAGERGLTDLLTLTALLSLLKDDHEGGGERGQTTQTLKGNLSSNSLLKWNRLRWNR